MSVRKRTNTTKGKREAIRKLRIALERLKRDPEALEFVLRLVKFMEGRSRRQRRKPRD